MILFRCPRCEAKMEVDETFAGRPARCPTCGSDLRVPKVGEAEPPAGAATPPRPGAATVKVGGESVEILPPIETMAIISLAVVAAALVAVLVLGVGQLMSPPWVVWVFGAVVALLGAMIGIPAAHNIRRSRGRKRGKYLAMIAMLGGGILFLVFLVGAIIGIAMQAAKPPCEENLKRIYVALKNYADKHGGALPDGRKVDLRGLVEEGYLSSTDWLICPAYHYPPGVLTYALTPDVNIKNKLFPDDLMIVRELPPYEAHKDGVRVLMLDGSIKTIPAANWAAFEEAQKNKWNDIQNKVRKAAAAAAAAAPAGTEAAPATPAPAPAPGGK